MQYVSSLVNAYVKSRIINFFDCTSHYLRSSSIGEILLIIRLSFMVFCMCDATLYAVYL